MCRRQFSIPGRGGSRDKPDRGYRDGRALPGSTEPDGFWRTIVSGRDCLTDVPASHWLIGDYYDPDPARPGKTYARRGAFLSPVAFEPLEHGIPPNHGAQHRHRPVAGADGRETRAREQLRPRSSGMSTASASA